LFFSVAAPFTALSKAGCTTSRGDVKINKTVITAAGPSRTTGGGALIFRLNPPNRRLSLDAAGGWVTVYKLKSCMSGSLQIRRIIPS